MDAFDVFDAHVHAGRWLTPDFAGRESSLDQVCDVLDRAGITGALVMPTDAGDNNGLLDAVAGRVGFPALRFAAWINPSAPGLPGWLEANASRIDAIKVHPSFCRLPITAPAFTPFLEFAREHSLPVVVHCGRWREVAGFELSLERARAFPEVPFILSHMGGDSPGLVLGAVDALGDGTLPNVHLGTESIREYWLVGRAVDALGPERLVFGSDHNLNHPKSFLAVLDALDISPDARALILGGNARRLINP
jgi:hypothetical protein